MSQRKLERFDFIDADLTPFLTDEQKKWKVLTPLPPRERFEVLEQQPTMTFRLHLRSQSAELDSVALAADILSLVQALSAAERELGGAGMVLSDRRSKPDHVLLILRHANPVGAEDRAAKLAAKMSALTPLESAHSVVGALELVGQALASPMAQVQLVLARSRQVAGCEVLAAV